MARYGAANPFWKGGRVLASNGYILVRVGTEHHLADVRGYAYEHRIVAEKKIGRRLRKGEQIHHINENKSDNDPANIEVMRSMAEHKVRHRIVGMNRRLPGQQNSAVACACGCGAEFPAFDASGRPRRFVSGHNLENWKR